MKLEGLGEKIFLDRYARKEADGRGATVGAVVLVLVKDDKKYPVKEVGNVIAIDGEWATVRLRNGETMETTLEKLVLPIETTPEEMWGRLAKALASAEEDDERKELWERRFKSILTDWKLVPGGRIAAGAGASDELTLFNCYVLPSPADSRGGIMHTLSDMTEVMARGGGVGINLSSLRPRRAIVAGVNGSSSGSVSWGGLFSYTTGLIEQGGSRRGALMLMLNDWHPDLLDFIEVKQKMGELTNANLSVCLSDAFMEAVKTDSDWELVFPDTKEAGYDELWTGDLEQWKRLGKRVVTYRTVKAKTIWSSIIGSAWRSAEPGVVFMERYNKMSNSWYFNPVAATNPCGEQGLPAWGVCNLAAVNLSQFYDAAKEDVNWDDLGQTTRWAVRFLDNVIDTTPYHFVENEANQKRERRIGLGTMGLAELLIKLGITYGDVSSLAFLDKLYGFMAKEAYLASAQLAAEKGAFPAFDAGLYRQSGFMRSLAAAYPEVGEAVAKHGIRNVTVLTQAPTGSTGTMVGTSTGIEPFFAFEFYRQSRLGFDKQLVPIAQQWKDAHPEEPLPAYFVSAMALSAEQHIRVQATIQRWVDSSISKTANCPADFTVEETARLYELAYELGCKGVTIYRDGSRNEQVLSTAPEEETHEEKKEEEPLSASSETSEQAVKAADSPYKQRPQMMRGATYRLNTPFGKAYITINDLNGTPSEIFLNVGKAGSDVFAMAEALGRVCSLFLRYGDHGDKSRLLVKHLKGIGGSGAIGFGAGRVESIADAVAKALELHLEEAPSETSSGQPPSDGILNNEEEERYSAVSRQPDSRERDFCPSCGSAALLNVEGCKTCASCGFSKCN